MPQTQERSVRSPLTQAAGASPSPATAGGTSSHAPSPSRHARRALGVVLALACGLGVALAGGGRGTPALGFVALGGLALAQDPALLAAGAVAVALGWGIAGVFAAGVLLAHLAGLAALDALLILGARRARGAHEAGTRLLDAAQERCRSEAAARELAEKERDLAQGQLAQAHKLEAIGQLAAGIAHEINTPTQYVADNARFLGTSFQDLAQVLDAYAEVFDTEIGALPWERRHEQMEELCQRLDVPFLREEIPKAIEQSLQGLEQITTIVRAMKDFSHPGKEGKTPTDVNGAIRSTVTVARNEWKYVAEMELDLASDLPPVPCLPGELNQALLNMIVNAAHAIEAKLGEERDRRGTIRVSTREREGSAEIRISDTGIGIPPENLSRIFDPFFTTKEVGKGTGQGLSIAHTVVVEKHGGELEVESEPGEGTAFTIRLPLGVEALEKEAAA